MKNIRNLHSNSTKSTIDLNINPFVQQTEQKPSEFLHQQTTYNFLTKPGLATKNIFIVRREEEFRQHLYKMNKLFNSTAYQLFAGERMCVEYKVMIFMDKFLS